MGASRDEALEILASEGVLLVLCSLIDNMPFVVAEAAVRSPAYICDFLCSARLISARLSALQLCGAQLACARNSRVDDRVHGAGSSPS